MGGRRERKRQGDPVGVEVEGFYCEKELPEVSPARRAVSVGTARRGPRQRSSAKLLSLLWPLSGPRERTAFLTE